ncbi:hypothetical protein C1Y40_01313 [Mycobacterium talmoniae]|uniref:Uncharacterized protein n=1 Tax=Mycobacterium talmoniae TaxID=1858794 RepID=A0A2S8BPA6_9MYCO|nr:hypothetical protein C1Y40_01313 [Mycobacterium talmoniae]
MDGTSYSRKLRLRPRTSASSSPRCGAPRRGRWVRDRTHVRQPGDRRQRGAAVGQAVELHLVGAVGHGGRADQRLQRGRLPRTAGTQDQHVGPRAGGVHHPRRLVVFERPVDNADREHQVARGPVVLLPRPAQEPVHQVVDRHRLIQRGLPQPVRLELDAAQLIDDHRADLRRPEALVFLGALLGGRSPTAGSASSGAASISVPLTATSSGVNAVVNSCGRM